jgi:type IV pilus assembly protein PilB
MSSTALPPVGTTRDVRLVATPAQLAALLAARAGGSGESPAAMGPACSLEQWRDRIGSADDDSFRIARDLGLPIADLQALAPEPRALARLGAASARRLQALPLAVRDNWLAVAIADPVDSALVNTLGFLCRESIVPLVAPPRLLQEAISRHYDLAQDLDIARQLGLDPEHEMQALAAVEAERYAREVPIVHLVNDLLDEAVLRRASDIHLRPAAGALELLLRVDDQLVPIRRFLRALAPAIVSRIKVLAGMNLAEHRKPQDGRTTHAAADGRVLDLRVSVLPAIHGESVVVRLLDTSQGLKRIDQIGFSPDDRVRLDDIIGRSHGMFLVTGPTGCGKTTTLYAVLQELIHRPINILTIEDPVEYHIDGIQQMQVNRPAGFTFASALRNFLRHDPDVMMVGEVRDGETAGIAVESALTGHLVLSTLHTNSAATAVIRLLDLGVAPYLLRASLAGVMAQRLVRRLCPHCRHPHAPAAHLRESMGAAPGDVFYLSNGCSQCDGSGVHGRRAVYELLIATTDLLTLVREGADAEAIQRQALRDGMQPLTQAGLELARAGEISLEEAFRVRLD